MIQKIIYFSAKNKFLVIFFTIFICIYSIQALYKIKLDALPDLSDTQVIVYSRWDRSPDIIEDQVTYPIVSSLLGLPKIKSIRGLSDFGYSFVYVIFEDGTDLYWARSRVLEYLSSIQESLPQGVKTELGPDASGVGWVYQYILTDKSNQMTIEELKSLHDFHIKFLLLSIPGVSEVASVGGKKKEYQIQIQPQKLISYNLSFNETIQKIKGSSNESGARLLEFSGIEYMVRIQGYVKDLKDLESIVVATDGSGNPVYLKNIAYITEGPGFRRGVTDWNGQGDKVGGIIVMRIGENALSVISKVEDKIQQIQSTLPPGVEIIPVYNRKELILETIHNLKNKLLIEIGVVSLVIFIFLWHIPSAIVPVLTIPISVLILFLPLYLLDIESNLMSLSGLAISIGVLVDGAIVEVENAYKKIHEWKIGKREGNYTKIRMEALAEVGPSVFYSLLLVGVSFFPIFALTGQEGKLFKPLAFTKNLTMFIAAFLAITVDPAVRMLFQRIEPFSFSSKILTKLSNAIFVGNYYSEKKHPISSRLIRWYEPLCKLSLKYPKKTIAIAGLLFITTIPIYLKLGEEFMPPFFEGSLLYMPTTMPGISITEAEKLLKEQGNILIQIPEVRSVYGKAGRADTATDPSPLSMIETTILLKPREEWRKGITKDKLIQELNEKCNFPGLSNAWTMPIRARIDMLTTGIRTPLGLKIQGRNTQDIEKVGIEIESLLKGREGIRNIYAERITAGYFIDIIPNRQRMARFGITMEELQSIISISQGGDIVAESIQGRERYGISIRYPRELRDSPEKLKRILVPTAQGGHVPLSELVDIQYSTGPGMIRNENGLLTSYVYIDTDSKDLKSLIQELQKIIQYHIEPVPGVSWEWSGQYESILETRENLTWILPITIVSIFFLVYLNTKSWKKTFIILTAIPFSLIGAIWLLFLLDYQISIAVWVGMIALLGLDAETGMFMLMYIDLSLKDKKNQNQLNNLQDFKDAILDGSVHRIRPKLMTVLCGILGLIPILLSDGIGSDMMKRIVAPMVGGLSTSFLLELLVYPPLVYLFLKKEHLPSTYNST